LSLVMHRSCRRVGAASESRTAVIPPSKPSVTGTPWRKIARDFCPQAVIRPVSPLIRLAWVVRNSHASPGYRRAILFLDEETPGLGGPNQRCRSETDGAERAQKLTTETRSPQRSRGLCCNCALESKRGQRTGQQQSAPVPSVLRGAPICPDVDPTQRQVRGECGMGW